MNGQQSDLDETDDRGDLESLRDFELIETACMQETDMNGFVEVWKRMHLQGIAVPLHESSERVNGDALVVSPHSSASNSGSSSRTLHSESGDADRRVYGHAQLVRNGSEDRSEEEDSSGDDEDDGDVVEKRTTPERGFLRKVSLKSVELTPGDDFDDHAAWSDNEAMDDDDEPRLSQRGLPAGVAPLKKDNGASPSQRTHSQESHVAAAAAAAATSGADPAQVASMAPTSSSLAEAVQSRLIREKIAELQEQIDRFRAENAKLDELCKQREEQMAALKRETEEFHNYKEEEMKKFEEYKETETKKLKKERRVFEQYQKASKSMNDRKDVDELKKLKSTVEQLKEEYRSKEAKWTSTVARLKEKIQILEAENEELRQDLLTLEKQRIENNNNNNRNKKKTTTTTTSTATSTTAAAAAMKHRFDAAGNGVTNGVTNGVAKGITNGVTNAVANGVGAMSLQTPSPSLPSQQAEFHSPLSTEDPRMCPASPYSDEHSAPIYSILNDTPTKKKFVDQPSGSASLSAPLAPPPAVAIKPSEFLSEIVHRDGKVEWVRADGSKVISFPNGTRKDISLDGSTTTVHFANGDRKEFFPDGRTEYLFTRKKVTIVTYPDGLEVLHFVSGQVEKTFPDGRKEIHFPNQVVKYIAADGSERSEFPGGNVCIQQPNGDQVLYLTSGEKEIHTKEYKRREYPDGSVKTLFPDGRQETRYYNGRLRIKDKNGNVVVDRIVRTS